MGATVWLIQLWLTTRAHEQGSYTMWRTTFLRSRQPAAVQYPSHTKLPNLS